MEGSTQTVSRTQSSSSPNTFKVYATPEEVLQEHLTHNTRFVIYRNSVFNVGLYLDGLGHPGGEKVISDYFGKDVTEAMHLQKHSRSAYKMLQNYKVGEVSKKTEYQIDKLAADNSAILKGHSLIGEEMADRIAKRFDLNRPIYPQIIDPTLSLDEYLAFITEPKIMLDPKKQIRIFDSDFFEFFSSTKWYAIPLFWFPIKFIVLGALLRSLPDAYSLWRALGLYVFGILHWTLTEYMLHRFLFHIDARLPTNGWLFGVHFLLHGIHHAFPQDPGRLVFPIINAVGVGLVMLAYFMVLFYWVDALFVLGGFGLGYICYDLFHYYTHHSGATLFDSQRRYHMKHHHKDPNRGFGVTTPTWDYVFGTVLRD